MRLLAILLFGITLAACTTVKEGREPDIQQAVNNRVAAGMEYLRMGKPMEAQRHLTRAVELMEDSPEAQNALAVLYRYQGDEEREEFHLKKALSADSDFGPARNNYGAYLMRQGEPEKAITQFRRAAEISNYDGRGLAYANAGLALRQVGRDEEAKKVFNRALRLSPKAVLPKLEMADIYFAEGELRVAALYYEQYVAGTDQQSARGLWLGIRIADAQGKQDEKASYEMALQNLYADTPEYEAWKTWKAQGGSS